MNATTTLPATIDPKGAAHFGAMAAEWWDPNGSSKMLHRLNPVRLGYVRAAIDRHWGTDPTALRPLSGRRALDVGCGAGLLTEPLARMGAEATGIDGAAETIAAARGHAAGQGLTIDYRAGGIEGVGADERFDLVCSMEVIEHVTDQPAFVRGLAGALADGGVLLMSTPNRTALSKLALITVGEDIGRLIPKGTHDWDRFLTPDELTAMLAAAGMRVTDVTGLSLSATKGFTLSDDVRMNYLLTAVRG
ncbi:bifunctional 2-polyprenyl-6-hydroxyphenol methylase/3-demethylubiquinol 3-O-methyltransferase UbiG [Sphingomonas montana]|uniref:bifunctional 2-polyprenyl-6-hydroxyphenol methylase/3-demethylubiquinol 3-O-methyltransferase UbiG n=1 Tax=Sphingomonas montana TaxID=1843236 RepID=UPI00096C9A43|nr:bifunctional 2-polyprenyl-6-hydroxyphenol methylase/3-demethylubiquinol 3-O-methyltransferase UbiG [Sphingomonas montana]